MAFGRWLFCRSSGKSARTDWLFGASSTPFRLTEERLLYDCTGPYCAEPAIYFRRARAATFDYRTARRAAHADRHFSGHSYPRDRRGLAVHRSAAGPDGRTDHHAVSACADDDGQRYRTYRREFL